MLKRFVNWIRNHQVLAFFVVSYAVSWPAMFLYYFAFPESPAAGMLLMAPAIYSPALVALLITHLADNKPKLERDRRVWLVFVVSWIIGTAAMSLHGMIINNIPGWGYAIFSAVFALIPAFILSRVYARKPDMRKVFGTLLKPRGNVLWYAVILLLFPGVPLLGMWITRWFGGDARYMAAGLTAVEIAIYLALELSKGFLFTGGINEESGWRGFALPRLQAKYPVIVAALIVGYLWSFWHIPYDLGRQVPLARMLENRLLLNPMMAVIMAWLYNRTKGSLLAPALLHPMMNAVGDLFELTIATRVLLACVVIVAVVTDRMWERLPDGHGAVWDYSYESRPEGGVPG